MRILVGLMALCALAACSSEPADISGTYDTAVTNRENGCEFDNWTEGEQNGGIEVAITQDGEAAEADVMGVVGGILDVWLGSSVFVGTVDGPDFELTIFGENNFSEGNCGYSFNAVLSGTIDGDFIEGDIRYTAVTNDNPDCAGIEGCVTRQSFNGSRPPQ